jgi:radical SAM protein with 4Fe4S-binding SPASM domain
MTPFCDWKTSVLRSRSRAQNARDSKVSTAEAFHLIEDVAQMRVPLLALTGGDPLLRHDLFPIVEFASKRFVRTSLALRPTPLLDSSIIPDLKSAGLMRIAVWLHGSTPTLNDSYWRIPGVYRRTLDIIGRCQEAQLPVQVNTIVARRNVHDLDPMIELLTRLDISMWNVFFFVPASAEENAQMLSADDVEAIFAKLYATSNRVHFQVTTTEAPHYQRYLLQQSAKESRQRHGKGNDAGSAPNGSNGRSSAFVNHDGEVYPNRFLPLSAGNVTTRPISELFRESPLFVSLADHSQLKGKCGRCPYQNACGGSRARAYAVTGDLFAPDPACAYEP